MDIEFCECGGVLAPAGKNMMKCRSCGKEINKKVSGEIRTESRKSDVIVIESNKPDRLPDTQKKCPKCGNERAYWWLIQTRSADEAPTQFFRCTNGKCKHTWREYK